MVSFWVWKGNFIVVDFEVRSLDAEVRHISSAALSKGERRHPEVPHDVAREVGR